MGVIVVLWAVVVLSSFAYSQPVEGGYEKGLIFTARNSSGTSAALWHLPVMPGYENSPKTVRTVRFNDPYLQFYSLDVDYRKKIAYVFEKHYRTLLAVENYTASMDNIEKAKSFHVGISSGTVQIAVDWLSHTIYWTDSTYRWIAAAPGAIEMMDNDIYKIIADTNLYYPDGIALDPLDGFLFWTDNGLHPKIERSDMAGRNRKTLITSGLIAPISIETDIKNKRIYWIDYETENIESSKYDGTDRVTLTRITVSTLFDLTIYRDVLAVTDLYNDRIMFLNTTNGEKADSSIHISNYLTYNVASYFLETQPWRADGKDVCRDLNCTHMCISTAAGAECACAEGFVYNQTNNKCDEDSKMYHRAMVLADETTICLTDIRVAAEPAYDCFTIFDFGKSQSPNITLPTNASLSTIAYIDVSALRRVLYIADSSGNIYRRLVDLPKEDLSLDLLTTASGTITGLAYDWIDGNLYWSQSNGAIYVISVKDSATRLVLANAGNVNNLVVMPHVRRLGFTIGGTIKSVLMDGTNMTTVLDDSSSTTISALVVDYDEHMFYWVSTNTSSTDLYQMTVYGNSLALLNNRIDRSTSLLAVYKGYIKWMYPKAMNASQTYYKSVTKLNPTATNPGYFNLRARVMKMLDASIQSMETDVCAYLNGGCEQICISYHTDENTYAKKCECTTGYTAVNNSCVVKTLSPVDFILVYDTTFNKVMQIDLNTNEQGIVPLKDVAYVYGLFYDMDTKRITWSERDNPVVYSAFLNGTGIKEVGRTGTSIARRFSKDETTGNIYYTSLDKSFRLEQHVGILTPSGESIVLVDDFLLDSIGSIAVHPGIGKMYYSVSTNRDSYIAEANMDGSDVRKLLKNLDAPDGVAIDYSNNWIYWNEFYLNTIQRCNLNGTNCSTIINETQSAIVVMRDLAVDGDLIYYTDYSKDAVVAYNMTDGKSKSYGTGLGRLADLWIYKRNSVNKQPVNKACQANNGRGDCSTLCLPKGSTDRTCKCNTGEYLIEDGRSCTNVYKCRSVIVQRDSTEVIISPTCNRRLNDVCAYQCPEGFIFKNASVSTVQCLNDGWDKQTETLCIKTGTPTCSIDYSSIANGDVTAGCVKTVGSPCDYTCKAGYKKTTEKVTCGTNTIWYPQNACQEIKCANIIENGFIPPEKCSFNVGISCEYSCGGVSAYEKNKTISMVTCLATGSWNQTTGLCAEIPGGIGSQVAAAGGSSGAKIGIGFGIAIALVVCIAGAVALFIFIKRRKSTEVPYSNASFHTQNDDIAIENPGYMTITGAQMSEHGIDTSQMNPVTFDPLPALPVKQEEDGFVNPLYSAAAQTGAGSMLRAQNGESVYASSQIVFDNDKKT